MNGNKYKDINNNILTLLSVKYNGDSVGRG